MVARAPEAIVFDCFGVLYVTNESIFNQQVLNTELVDFITSDLKPHYKIGLLSNIDRDWINNFISKHQLQGLFDAVVVSGDDFHTKPHPTIYRRISNELGVEPEKCLMVDDIVENCKGAEAVGMGSIHFTSNHMLWDHLGKLNITT